VTEARATHPVKVQILDGAGNGPMVTFRLPVVRIGRDPGCEICLGDPSVSRVHCAIHRQGERAILVVGHSRNPTFVNGMKASNVELRPGDTLSICEHTFRFDPPADAKAADDPATVEHLDSPGKDKPEVDAGEPLLEPLTPASPRPAGRPGALQAVLVGETGDDDDSEDVLELDLGRPDEEKTRVMSRDQIRPPQAKGMPPGGKAEVVARTGPGRSDDEHTRILPRGGAKKAPKKGGQAVILASEGAPPQQPQPQQPQEALSVAIQETPAPPKPKKKKGPLQNNGVRAAALAVMLLLALVAWKDAIFGGAEEAPTTRRAVGSDQPDLVIDRGGRDDNQLVADSKKAYDVGSKKMEEHHLQDENLTVAIHMLTEAQTTLQLMGSPPSLLGDVEARLKEAEELREEKYRDSLFHYQKLKRSGDYREGREELEFIMRLIADESDPRYQDAARELLAIDDSMKDRRR
jgi:hypothetical protein